MSSCSSLRLELCVIYYKVFVVVMLSDLFVFKCQCLQSLLVCQVSVPAEHNADVVEFGASKTLCDQTT